MLSTRKVVVSIVAVIGVVIASAWWPAHARVLSFEERVAAQKAIEQVYWNHRIWPTENPGPKPQLATVMPEEAIRARVEDYLKKSTALEMWWQRPIAAEQLQAELDRMAQSTKDGAMLQELHLALGNDPLIIAETLVRQTLVERLVRSWYSSDTRIHGAVRAKAEAALAMCATADCMKSKGGEYGEATWRRDDVGADDWRSRVEELATKLGASPSSLPIGRWSGLEEAPDAFVVITVLAQGERELTSASVAWRKRSFDAWWSEQSARIRSDGVTAAGTYAIAAPAGASCVNDTWEQRFYAPSWRREHTAVWTGTEMIVWGGYDFSANLNTGGRYSPATDSWTPTSTGANVPSGRRAHSAVWTGTEMIVWGGYTGSAASSSGGRYDPSIDAWTATSSGANVPLGRSGHTAVWTGTQMIVWGGADSGYMNTGGRYTPSTDSWLATSTGTNVPAGRWQHTAVWTGTQMIVWGGYFYNGADNFLNTGGRYDPSTNSWLTTATSANAIARHSHTAVWTGTHMVVWGGYVPGSTTNTGGRYNPTTNSWLAVSTGANVPQTRFHHTAVWTGTQMVVWGGSGSGYLSTGGRYNPTTNAWLATSVGANLPVGRQFHTAVWTGTEMIVWGGSNATAVNSGGRYNPVTDSWLGTPSGATVPIARYDHTAVWTGTEMIVWGGASTGFQFTGGRYNPATDSWTATSQGANVPSGRYLHTASWTGTEMIVWGGYSGAVALNSGGRYNPATDGWTATSVGANVPAARRYHTASWTGTELIVWGGFDSSASGLNTGGRYDPSTDSWTPTSVGANVPTTRYAHSSVWTGVEMIVWGGASSGGFLTTGGRYDPSTDSWSEVSTSGSVPDGRHLHTAVWTGAEMIVWGGLNGGVASSLNSGGRYDPMTDGWTATATGANVPAARASNTTVWTGAEMIVWGGQTSDSPSVSTGGRYDPSTDSWVATSTGPGAPSARRGHSAVWTGGRMIVWAGAPINNNLDLYCGCTQVTFYRDVDGDTYGNPGVTLSACDGSLQAGYVLDNSDCDDSDASIHPDAAETCNGLDDDCDLTADNGGASLCDDGDACTDDACSNGACSWTPGSAPPEVSSLSASKSGATVTFDWSPSVGAITYDMLRGRVRNWPVGSTPATETCFDTVAATMSSDPAVPPVDDGYWYLIRAENACGNGGYGSEGSHGVPTVPRQSGVCP